jgi:hypothetical protein
VATVSSGEQGSSCSARNSPMSFITATFDRHYSISSSVRRISGIPFSIDVSSGDSTRSKMESTMVNGVLCKILCHNICCLIQEQCELGIEPIFWKDEEREQMEESGYLKVSRA